MEIIQDLLNRIEQQYNVQILYACESGSRAWGFPSPDSDYDIRFIYKHPTDWYLAIESRTDTINLMDGDLDASGWDLRKALQLLKKSNAGLIDYFSSPIEYRSQQTFRADFMELATAYFSPKAVFYHHYGLLGQFLDAVKDEQEVKLKKWFYLLRSLLMCVWVIKHPLAPPPMDIYNLMELLTAAEKQLIVELIAAKSQLNEKDTYPNTPAMETLIDQLLATAKSGMDNLAVNKQDYALLNQFFLNTLQQYNADERINL